MSAISLCMIVCNEENNLQRCLESAIKFVDEVIIVDTGSTDQTTSICKSFGAQIYDYTWANDFASARNYSISKASWDRILLLAAEEEFVIRDFPALKHYLQNNLSCQEPAAFLHYTILNSVIRNYSNLIKRMKLLNKFRFFIQTLIRTSIIY